MAKKWQNGINGKPQNSCRYRKFTENNKRYYAVITTQCSKNVKSEYSKILHKQAQHNIVEITKTNILKETPKMSETGSFTHKKKFQDHIDLNAL